MQTLIKNGQIVEDSWVLVKEANNAGILQVLPGRRIIVPCINKRHIVHMLLVEVAVSR